jgi:hypothetical protein
MYDYLAKIILLGPSGTGKYVTQALERHREPLVCLEPANMECDRSCLLHRFVKNEWRVLSSQTIGVEFASKIIKVGTGARRKRIKLQVSVLAQLDMQCGCSLTDHVLYSSGILLVPNDSDPFRDLTIAAPPARFSSTTSPPAAHSSTYNPSSTMHGLSPHQISALCSLEIN